MPLRQTRLGPRGLAEAGEITLVGPSIAWSNMPLAVSEYQQGSTSWRSGVSLAGYYRSRLDTGITLSGAAGSIMWVEASIDGGANFVRISGNLAVDTTLYQAGAWGLIPPSHRKAAILRMMGSGGDGATSPFLRTIRLILE